MFAAIAAFMAIYIVVVALSIPGALFLTITGGILFGTLLGGAATVDRRDHRRDASSSWWRSSACGENLVRRAGPLACKIAAGFRADAFSYLLFLRLVPAFPFFLVNLVPALAGVKLRTFIAATAIGIMPGDLRLRVSRRRPRQRDRRAGRAIPRLSCRRPQRLPDSLRHQHDRDAATPCSVRSARRARAYPGGRQAAERAASRALEPRPAHLNTREGAWPKS